VPTHADDLRQTVARGGQYSTGGGEFRRSGRRQLQGTGVISNRAMRGGGIEAATSRQIRIAHSRRRDAPPRLLAVYPT